MTHIFQTYVSAPTPNVPPMENNTQNVGEHETDSSALTPAVRKGPEGKDNESFLHEDVDKDSGTFQMYSCLHWLWFGRILWYMVALTFKNIYLDHMIRELHIYTRVHIRMLYHAHTSKSYLKIKAFINASIK